MLSEGALAPNAVDPEIAALVAEHGNNPEAILAIFETLQSQRGGLAQADICGIARALRIPTAQAYGVATFYSMLAMLPRPGQTLRVCDGPACWLDGAIQVQMALEANLGEGWNIERTSCLGLCDRAPAALVDGHQCGPLTPERVPALQNGWRGEARVYAEPRQGETRVLLAHAGAIDPDSIDSALAHGAYRAFQRMLAQSPETVLTEIESAGLRGRGGAGFPTGRKWRTVAQDDRSLKYVVCNADESEPLVFKDRVLIDTNPHQLLEGMMLAAYAVGACEGFIYIRGEYKAQAARLERAVQQAKAHGWLGERIHGTDFSFHVHLHRGAGAYICGEETALLESLEGRRGEPRTRPPFPATHGYHGQPTVVNNVETFAAIPSIVASGAARYRATGNPSMPGTKLYTLLGHVNRPGLFEAPFGLTLRQVIEEFGGGMRPGSTFHFALTGGAAGTIVPPTLLDLPIDYTSAAKGVALGAGAFLVCDQSVSPVALLRELLHFFASESCGKCTPCRVGTRRAREVLDGLVARQGRTGDIDELRRLADLLQAASFCGLGQSVAIPMRSALAHFGSAFEVPSSAVVVNREEE
ncbi:MAG TPA: NADH-quinone oxidoreductase subunit NuoF [Chloroflexi bacterium]|nr:NADH-quinone oxidoreductase subunit NuoF [Chloroflexota bacterium]